MSNIFSQIEEYYSYDEFIALMEQLVANEQTTGPNQTDRLISFTKLNAQRMRRVAKTTKLDEGIIAKLKQQYQQVWWVITEAWCGDSAQNLPAIAKLADASDGKIELRIILRDEHLEAIDSYLTNGARSIPKLIAKDKDGKDIFTWGPRPQHGQDMLKEWKANPNGKSHDDFEQDLHTWYAKNKGEDLIAEFHQLLQ